MKNTRLNIKPFLIVAVSALFYLFMFFVRVLPTVMTQDLMVAFNSSSLGIGTLIVSFVYTYALVQIPAGMLIDKHGPKKIMLISMTGCVIGGYLFQSTNNLVIATLSRALIGLCCAPAFVAPMAFVKQWLPEKFFTPAAGCIQLLGCVGAMLAQPCADLVLSIGWRDAVFTSVLLSLALLVIFQLVLEEKPQPQEDSQKLSTREALSYIVYSKHYWHVALIAMASWAAIGGFSESWGITYLSSLQNISISAATQQMNWCWIGVALASPLVGLWSENTENRAIPLITVFTIGLVSLSCLLSALFSDNLSISFLLFALGISAGAQPIAFKLASDISPKNLSATAISFCNVCVIAGAFLTQPIVSYLIEYTWDGTLVNNLPLYSTTGYQISFLPIIAILIFAIIAASFIHKLPINHETS